MRRNSHGKIQYFKREQQNMNHYKQELLAKLLKQEKIYGLIFKTTIVVAIVLYLFMNDREDLPSIPFIILIVISAIIGLLASMKTYFISKQYNQVTIEALKEIFDVSINKEENSYTFDIDDEEEKVVLDANGIQINEENYRYDEYEIGVSIFCFLKTIYFAINFERSVIDVENEEFAISSEFSIEVTKEVYQAIKQFNITFDTESTKQLDYLVNNTEEAVKMLFSKGFLKV